MPVQRQKEWRKERQQKSIQQKKAQQKKKDCGKKMPESSVNNEDQRSRMMVRGWLPELVCEHGSGKL